LDRVLDLLEPFGHRAHRSRNRLRGMGVSLAGLVDLMTGGACPLRATSAGSTYRLGEIAAGAIRAARSVRPWTRAGGFRRGNLGRRLEAWRIFLSLGKVGWFSGLGSSMFLGGRPYGGDHGFAGVFGHNTVDENNGLTM